MNQNSNGLFGEKANKAEDRCEKLNSRESDGEAQLDEEVRFLIETKSAEVRSKAGGASKDTQRRSKSQEKPNFRMKRKVRRPD